MKGNDQFHDSEAEDVGDVGDLYDLFNACNGEVLGGVLNLRKLEDLSKEECEVLDVARLKKLGAHVISGCPRCRAIIDKLNYVRAALRRTVQIV